MICANNNHKNERIIAMIENDTTELLKECDAGVKMGISSLEEVIDKTENEDFRKLLSKCTDEHKELEKQIENELAKFDSEGKNPNPLAKGMSWIKTNVMLGMDKSDKVIADLLTDGCNMGVKSLNSYLNEYEAAEEYAKDIAKKLINLEERLTVDMRDYL